MRELHTENKRRRCNICHQEYTRKSNLDIHIRSVHTSTNSVIKLDSESSSAENIDSLSTEDSIKDTEEIQLTEDLKSNINTIEEHYPVKIINDQDLINIEQKNIDEKDLKVEIGPLEVASEDRTAVKYPSEDNDSETVDIKHDSDALEINIEDMIIMNAKVKEEEQEGHNENKEPCMGNQSEGVSFKCTSCSMKLSNHQALKAHMKIHEQSNSFECKKCHSMFDCQYKQEDHETFCKTFACYLCEAIYKYDSHLKEHIVKVHSGIPYECDLCEKSYRKYCNLSRHKSVAHTRNRFKCVMCNQVFTKRENLKRHIRQVHQIMPKDNHIERSSVEEIKSEDEEQDEIINDLGLPCKFCTKSFLTKKSLKAHIRNHLVKKEATFQCAQCPQKFVYQSLLDRHAATHLKPVQPVVIKEYACDLCDKSYSHKQSLKSHMIRDHPTELFPKGTDADNGDPVQCLHCSMTFEYASLLDRHLATHNMSKRQFACTICDKSYALEKSLQWHMGKSHSVMSYQCGVCEENFKLANELTRHKNEVHANKKLFHCNECNQEFVRLDNLNRHKKKHGVRTCDICKVTFQTQKTLKVHIRLHHTEEKFYPCDQCSQLLSSKHSLERHMEIHEVKKCNICKKTFTGRANLKNHMLGHTAKKMHPCNECDNLFSSSQSLHRHTKSKHHPKNEFDSQQEELKDVEKVPDETKDEIEDNQDVFVEVPVDVDCLLVANTFIIGSPERSLAEINHALIFQTEADTKAGVHKVF